MKFQFTDNALRCLAMHPEFHLPLSAVECLRGGINYNGYDRTPDLSQDFLVIEQKIDKLKAELNKVIRTIVPKNVSILPSKFANHNILEKVNITLITTKDENVTYIPVRNLFKFLVTRINEYSYDTVVVKPQDSKNLLGVYQPLTGTICIWIDKIIKEENPELIFQKVLIHELIHAFLDIHPRVFYRFAQGISILSSLGNKMQGGEEETYDNALVLRAYMNYPNEFKIVKDFIQSQPQQYKDAVNYYAKEDLIELLRQHLYGKISREIIISPDDLYFEIKDDSSEIDGCNLEISEEIFLRYIEDLRGSLDFIFDLDDIFKLFDDSSQEFKCHRFLSGGELFEHYYYSPWLSVTYDDSAKEILLQIGEKFFIRYDGNNIIKVYRRNPGQDLEEITVDSYFYCDLDPTKSDGFVQSLVSHLINISLWIRFESSK